MANSPAALISYPCFEDLQKSNITFVESIPNPKKSRRLSRGKNEQSVDNQKKSSINENVNKNNITRDNELFRNTTVRIKKNDIQILPTLDEKEEKVEATDRSTDDGKYMEKIREKTELPTNDEKRSQKGDAANKNLRMKPKSKFSNHTLVADNRLIKPSTSECNTECNTRKQGAPSEQSSKIVPDKDTATCGLGALQNGLWNSESEMLRSKQDMPTLMPNTSEFQLLNVSKVIRKSIDLATFDGRPKLESESEESPNAPKCRTNAKVVTFEPDCCNGSKSDCFKGSKRWRAFLAILWALTFTGLMAFLTLTTEKDDVAKKNEPIKYEHRNYELLLLIARNVCRLVSSFYSH